MDAEQVLTTLFPQRQRRDTAKMRRLKVRIGNQLPCGLEVVDAETGEQIEGVADVNMSAPIDGCPTVHLDLRAHLVDWEGPVNKTPKPKAESQETTT